MIVLAKDLIAEAKEEKLKILEKCKIICIDFDFTAMIWTNRITEFGEERYNCFLRGENFYLKHAIGVPNPIIDKFLERYYKGTDKKLYLMSATEPFAEAMKVEYVNKMFNYKFENGYVIKQISC